MRLFGKQVSKAAGKLGEFKSEDERWLAVCARDKRADGVFFFGVETTGIYCRPSCGARQPRRENVVFFDTQEEAVNAGYRACKRCKPDATKSWNEQEQMVARACRFIEAAETAPKLEAIAAEVGLSPYHFHRIFKEVTGVTPKAYAASHREQAVRDSLRNVGTVTEAIYDAGYNANSRFYEKAQSFLGMQPQEFKKGGYGKTIHYVIRECALGLMLLAATDQGVCSIRLGDDAGALEAELQTEFPGAMLTGSDDTFETWVDTALELIDARRPTGRRLPLDIRGTVFQQRVWKALQTIPVGETASYKEIAEKIGSPKAVRAVAQACANNPVAVAVPCHRVVRSDGALSGYRWGVERKKKLLEQEKAQ